MKKTYLGLIPARGGSKGIPRKNVRKLAGEPLISHTIEAARSSKHLDRTVVSTDDREIRAVCEEAGAEVPFLRPAELATDSAPMEPVVEHAVTYLEDEEAYSCDTVVLLQPTAPLRQSRHIDEAVERHGESGRTTLISVCEDHSYRWEEREGGALQLNYTGDASRRQDKSTEYVENGAIYIVDTETFLDQKDLRSGSVELFEMAGEDSVDIDTEFEFWLAEMILRRDADSVPDEWRD